MKKSLIVGLLGLAASIAPSFGQGIIILDNYNTGGPNVVYGAGVPINGQSGALGTVGGAVSSANWTVGLYWAAGNQVGSVIPGSGTDIPTGGGIALGTGTGSTAIIAGPLDFNTPGQFLAGSTFTTPGVAAGGTITLEIVAYSGANYAASNYRGHSSVFTMTVADPTGAPNAVGTAMSGFSVLPVPEPSIFALSGLGAAALMLVRRKK
jgi:hypothetical protein